MAGVLLALIVAGWIAAGVAFVLLLLALRLVIGRLARLGVRERPERPAEPEAREPAGQERGARLPKG